MRRVIGAALIAVLLVATAGTGGVAGQDSPDSTSITMTVEVRADGDARWTVATRFVLENESDREAFRSLETEFEDGDGDIGYSVDAFRRAAGLASNATGREMAVTRVNRTAGINESDNRTVGVLRLSFTWTNFARTGNGSVVVGDAFNTTGGTWLPALREGQRLVVEPPSGYGIDNAPVDTDPDSLQNSVITWRGPQSFEPGDLRIRYTRAAAPTPTPTPPDDGRSLLVVLGLGGVGAGVAVLAVYLRQRDPEDAPEPVGHDDAGGASGAVPDEEDGDEEADAEVDLELLSDEERVLHMLERNGGRMKQANIVTETGWSNAKVSQLLSSMAEDGEVEKLRIGRENLISLPEEDVTDIDEE